MSVFFSWKFIIFLFLKFEYRMIDYLIHDQQKKFWLKNLLKAMNFIILGIFLKQFEFILNLF